MTGVQTCALPICAAFGNNNTDTCARVCHSPTGYGLRATFGTSAGTQNFDSVEHADVQGESAPGVFSATGRWREVTDHRDLAGRPRYLTARLAR